MATALTQLSVNHADRWSTNNLESFRAYKRKMSDETVQKHVRILENLAKENHDFVPSYKWLNENGHFSSYQAMLDYPAAFAHLRLEADKKFEIYKAHNSASPIISAPITSTRTLADYDVPGAMFNPIKLDIQPGLTEREWMQIGRAISHVGESTRWWIGDLILYGVRTYGKKVTLDLAQQATGVSRSYLYTAGFVARRFPAERRVAALSFYHHSILASFKPELADRLLAEAVQIGYTARQLRALADEEVGKIKANKNRIVVFLQDETYDQLRVLAKGRPLEWVVAQLIVDRLNKWEEL